MHPRNVFRTPPDFKKLGELYPDLQKHLIQARKDYFTLNFKDPESLKILTCSLASQYFDLTLELPSNRLIPTLPLRLNYLLWIEDLLSYHTTSNEVVGIDIGTGASAVYALLGYQKFGWKFLATETDTMCYESALNNVIINSFQDEIVIKLVKKEGGKLQGNLGSDRYTFCMCNPPFFEDTDNMTGISRSPHRAAPKSVCTATPVEVITTGGEEQFVGEMVRESIKLGTQVLWYTSMLGRKTSLDHILGMLSECGVKRVAVTEFKQGNTTRWGVAWSHEPSIPPLLSPNSKKVSTSYNFSTKNTTAQTIITKLQSTLAQLHVQVSRCPDQSGGIEYCAWVTAAENTWAHNRRKRRKRGSQKRESDGNGSLTQSGKRHCSDEKSSEQTLRNDNQSSDTQNSIDIKSNSLAEKVDSSHSVLDITSSSVSESSKVCLFHCLLSVEESEEGVSVDFTWIFGSDKDCLNQFCCFVAKSICNPDTGSCG
ncbi:hypothetical protein ACHWQZ_G013737 [Mnemiopsis leidyi]